MSGDADRRPGPNEDGPGPLVLLTAAYAFLGLAFGLATEFHAASNDFWGNYFIALHMDSAEPASFFNRFFPLGYNLLLKGLDRLPGHPTVAAYLFNLMAASGLLLILGRFARRLYGTGWALFLMALVALFPRFLHYAFLPGADLGAVAFLTAGILLAAGPLISEGEPDQAARHGRCMEASCGRFFAAGLLLGLSGLWRYHCLAAGVLFIAMLLIFYRRHAAWAVCCALGLALAYSPQITVNLLSGHGLLETARAFHVYTLMYPVNWYHLDAVQPLESSARIILGDPGRFAATYFRHLAELSVLFLPPLAAAMVATDARLKRFLRAYSLFAIAYALMVSMSPSSRAVLPLLPLAILWLVSVYQRGLGVLGFDSDGDRRFRRILRTDCGGVRLSRRLVWLFVVALHLAPFSIKAVHKLQERREHSATFREVEEILAKEGAARGEEIYSTDLDLYFMSIPPYRPRFSGGWLSIDTYGWRESYPTLNTGSVEDLVMDCRRHGIGYLVLDGNTRLVSQRIFAALYLGKAEISGVESVDEAGDHRVLRITELRPCTNR